MPPIRSGADGRVLKIVTLEDAKKLNVPVHKGTQPDLIPTTDEVITQVMPLRYIDATRLRQDLTPLISPSASITSNAAGNALIVTDTSANVHRIAEIVWALDTNTAGAAEVRIYALKYADATSAAKLITDIFKPDQTTGGPGGFFAGHAPVHDAEAAAAEAAASRATTPRRISRRASRPPPTPGPTRSSSPARRKRSRSLTASSRASSPTPSSRRASSSTR